MKYPGFIGGAYTLDAYSVDSQDALNLYVEKVDSGSGKSGAIMRLRPGLLYWDNAPKNPIRAMLQTDTALYVGAGDTLYERSTGGSWTSRGTIGDDTPHSPAQIIPNGTQLLIVSAGNAFYDNGAGVVGITFTGPSGTVDTADNLITKTAGDDFTPDMEGKDISIGGVNYRVSYVTDGTTLTVEGSAGTNTGVSYSFNEPTTALSAAFIGGYGIINPPDSKSFYISALYDFTSWDALDYGVKESYPDNITRLFANENQLWLLGQETTEIWQLTGEPDFPFSRVSAGYMSLGCAARWSVCKIGGGVGWVARDSRGIASAVIARGYTPQRVSTHAIEQEWAGYSDITDAEAYTYFEGGHEFWQITFPSANSGNGATWVYDVLTGLWHRQSYNGVTNRHRGRFHQYWLTQKLNLVADYGTSGNIYVQSSDYLDDNTTAITWLRSAPHIAEENKWISYAKFQLDMQMGAIPTGTGAVTLEYSDDGGHNWSTAKSASTGATSAYKVRAIWRRLGRSRDRVFRVKGSGSSGKYPVALIDAYLDVSEGTS